jgi:hypothetical protein
MSRNHFAVITALLALLLIVHVAPIVVPDRTAPSWEYRIESLKDGEFRSEMNRIGNAGWELVFARRAISGEGASSEASYEVIFKRPR